MSDNVSTPALQVVRAAYEAGMSAPEDVLKFINADDLERGDDGKVVGLSERVSELKEAKPHLFHPLLYDPNDSRPVGQQVSANIDRFHQEQLAKHNRPDPLLKSLDVKELSAREFEDYMNALTGKGVGGVMARGRLEAAARRQADVGDANRRGLHQAI